MLILIHALNIIIFENSFFGPNGNLRADSFTLLVNDWKQFSVFMKHLFQDLYISLSRRTISISPKSLLSENLSVGIPLFLQILGTLNLCSNVA